MAKSTRSWIFQGEKRGVDFKSSLFQHNGNTDYCSGISKHQSNGGIHQEPWKISAMMESSSDAPPSQGLLQGLRCGPDCLQKRVPISYWLPRYKLADLLPDFIAGFTVGLTLIPQSMGYAGLAGLEPQYGLYSAFLGSFVYIVFGTVKEVNLGPAALLSLLTFNYTHHLGPQFAVLLCFIAGCIELLFGLLHLGFLVEFVSIPVVSGFTSAAALMIASAQVKGLLGLKFDAETFVETWSNVFGHITEIQLWDAVLGVSCCVVLLLLKFMPRFIKFGDKDGKGNTKQQAGLNQTLFFISTARNAIVVLICAGLAAYLHTDGAVPFLLTGKVVSGLPPIQLPPLTAEVGNSTLGFVEMVGALGSGVIVTPVVAIISNMAIGKAFAQGRILDATQEMMTLGLCNIAGSLVGSMPVSGSFSRSAVSNASGIRSPLAGLYTGIMVILSLSLLTPYFYFIPRATLAAVIMCAVIFLIDVDVLAPMWRTSKSDVAVLAATFAACLLLGMEKGLVTGVALGVALLLYTNARPDLRTQLVTNSCIPEYIVVTPSLGLLFPASDHLRSSVKEAVQKYLTSSGSMANVEKPSLGTAPIVMDCCNVAKVDFTAAQGVKSLSLELEKEGRCLILLHVRPSVLRVFHSAFAPHSLHHAPSEAELAPLLRELSRTERLLESPENIAIE